MAIDSGCLCVISIQPCTHPHTLLLPDTTDALEGMNRIREAYIKASAYIRSLHKAKVITVTGSVGKTSTKEMIEAVLRQHYKNPLISKGNNNSMFSITRNIQSLKRTTNVCRRSARSHRKPSNTRQGSSRLISRSTPISVFRISKATAVRKR